MFDFDFSFLDGIGESIGDVGDYLFGDELIGPLPEGVAEAARPNVGGIFDDVGDALGTFSKVAGAAGQVSDLFTSSADRKAAATPQFATRDMSLQIDDLDALRTWIESNTQANQIPTRRLTAEEMTDDVFKPNAVMALQDYYDAQSAPSTATAAQSPQVLVDTTANADQQPLSIPQPADAVPAQDQRFEFDVLPGWDESSQIYTTPFGSIIRGEQGRKAAESAAVDKLFRQSFVGDPRTSVMPSGSIPNGYSWALGAFRDGEESGVNRFNGNPWNRSDAIRALQGGDSQGFIKQAHAKIYDPTPSTFGKIMKVAKPILLGAALAPIGGAFGAAASGALGGGTVGTLAGAATKTLTNQALGSAFSG